MSQDTVNGTLQSNIQSLDNTPVFILRNTAIGLYARFHPQEHGQEVVGHITIPPSSTLYVKLYCFSHQPSRRYDLTTPNIPLLNSVRVAL